MAYWKRLEV